MSTPAYDSLRKIAVLSAGGALGVNARYWAGVWAARWVDPGFPWATVAINVSGSFAIGFLARAIPVYTSHPHARLLVIVGVLGGFTTFSSFSHETLMLMERGRVGPALGNALGSVAAGFAAVALGAALARALVPGPAETPRAHPPSVTRHEGVPGVDD